MTYVYKECQVLVSLGEYTYNLGTLPHSQLLYTPMAQWNAQ